MNLTFQPPLGVTTTVPLDDAPGRFFKLFVTLSADDYLAMRRDRARIEVWSNMPVTEGADASRWSGIGFEAEYPLSDDIVAQSEIEDEMDGVLVPKVVKDLSDMQISLAAAFPIPTTESQFTYTFRIVRPSGVQWLGTTTNNGTLVVKKDAGMAPTFVKPTNSWDVVHEDSLAIILSPLSTEDNTPNGSAPSLGKTVRILPIVPSSSSNFIELPATLVRRLHPASPSLVVFSQDREARFLDRDDTEPLKIHLGFDSVEFTILPTHTLRFEDDEKAADWDIAIIHPSSYHSTLTHFMSDTPTLPNGSPNGDSVRSTDMAPSDRPDHPTNFRPAQYLALVESIPLLRHLLSFLLLHIIRLGIISRFPWLWTPISSRYKLGPRDYKSFDSRTVIQPPPVQRRLPRFSFIFPWWTSSEGIRFLIRSPTSDADALSKVAIRVGDHTIALSSLDVGVKVERLTGMDGWMVSIDGAESEVGQRLEIGLRV